MRYFLYTYTFPQNYDITREHRVFGTPKSGGDHLATKVERLRPGDIVLIRNAAFDKLYFFRHCVVTGPIYDQDEGSPWPPILWYDEKIKNRVIYHLRCAVDFENTPYLSLSQLTWDHLDSLRFINERGKLILGAQAWGKKLSGNFIQDPAEVARFNELVEYEAPQGLATVDG